MFLRRVYISGNSNDSTAFLIAFTRLDEGQTVHRSEISENLEIDSDKLYKLMKIGLTNLHIENYDRKKVKSAYDVNIFPNLRILYRENNI